MKDIIKIFKELSYSGIIFIHFGDRKIRIVNSSNFVSSIQRILPELGGSEKVEFIRDGSSKQLRSLMCYIHKKRLERLGYNIIKCSVKKWWLCKKAEEVDGDYKWVVRVRNTYDSMIIGIFDRLEMDEFLKEYYPGGMISAVVISSNNATKRYYEIHQKG